MMITVIGRGHSGTRAMSSHLERERRPHGVRNSTYRATSFRQRSFTGGVPGDGPLRRV